MPHLEGREIGGCKLIRKIGAGGMGDVYLAEQIRVGNRSVAVKVVSPDDLTFHPEAATDIARRFEREAAILGNLSHPNILPVHDSGIQDGMLYLVMQYAPDGSLADALHGNGNHPLTLPLPLPFTLDLVSQVADALYYTHQHGIVHRDVKPGNVLIRVEPSGHWHVLLADFGVARSVEIDSQRTQVTGTFIYMAPEQFSARFSPASDQYALAVMTFQLLAGRPPFDGDLATLTRAHMYETPPSLHAINPAVPAAVDAVITRALAKDPKNRYLTVADFASALRAAAGLEGEPTQAAGSQGPRAAVSTVPIVDSDGTSPTLVAVEESPTSVARARRRSSPWRVLVTVLIGVLLVALLFAGQQYLSRSRGSNTGHTSGPTQTASTRPTATATLATGSPSATVIAGTPVCSGALQISQDANCIPAPPSTFQGTSVVNDPSPLCVSTGIAWSAYTDTKTKCPTSGGVQVTATSTGQLGCLEANGVTVADGYASVFVTQGTGDPVLVFRQGFVNNGSVENSTGYFFKVATTSSGSQYIFYRIDSTGSAIIQNPSISGTLAQHYVMSVLYTGTTFTFYINGQQIGTITDSSANAISSGWYGLCVDGGNATFQSAQNYKAAGS
jgi:serine/threonine protein kinase